MSENLKNQLHPFPKWEPALDVFTFGTAGVATCALTGVSIASPFGMGILAASGVNAIASGTLSLFFGSNDPESQFIKLCATVVLIAGSAFALPYAAAALGIHSFCVITTEIALTMGILDIFTKISTFTTYRIGSWITGAFSLPSNLKDLGRLSSEQLKKVRMHFEEHPNSIKELPLRFQVHLNGRLENSGEKPFAINAFSELGESWQSEELSYLRGASLDHLPLEMRKEINQLFYDNQVLPQPRVHDLEELPDTLQLSGALTRADAHWAHLYYKKHPNKSVDSQLALEFYKWQLPPIGEEGFDLKVPEVIDSLSTVEICWHFNGLLKNLEKWDSLTPSQKNAYIARFTEANLPVYRFPLTKENLDNLPLQSLRQLYHALSKSPELLYQLPLNISKHLLSKCKEFGIGVYSLAGRINQQINWKKVGAITLIALIIITPMIGPLTAPLFAARSPADEPPSQLAPPPLPKVHCFNGDCEIQPQSNITSVAQECGLFPPEDLPYIAPMPSLETRVNHASTTLIIRHKSRPLGLTSFSPIQVKNGTFPIKEPPKAVLPNLDRATVEQVSPRLQPMSPIYGPDMWLSKEGLGNPLIIPSDPHLPPSAEPQVQEVPLLGVQEPAATTSFSTNWIAVAFFAGMGLVGWVANSLKKNRPLPQKNPVQDLPVDQGHPPQPPAPPPSSSSDNLDLEPSNSSPPSSPQRRLSASPSSSPPNLLSPPNTPVGTPSASPRDVAPSSSPPNLLSPPNTPEGTTPASPQDLGRSLQQRMSQVPSLSSSPSDLLSPPNTPEGTTPASPQDLGRSLEQRMSQVPSLLSSSLIRSSSSDALQRSSLNLNPKQQFSWARFKDYVENYCPNVSGDHALDISPEKALEFAKEGIILMQDLWQAKEVSRDNLQHKLRCIIWGLMFHAISKNQGFIEGTFHIVDPGYRLYDFLKPLFYLRDSSHYQKRSVGPHQGHNLYGLPAGKRTVLIGKLAHHDSKEHIFLKPENWGFNINFRTDPDAFSRDNLFQNARHSLEFLETRFQGKQAEYWRKEHFPNTNEVSALKTRIDSVCAVDLPFDLKEWGFAHAIPFLQEALKRQEVVQDNDLHRDILSYLTRVSQEFDHLETRKGTEVILDRSLLNWDPNTLVVPDRDILDDFEEVDIDLDSSLIKESDPREKALDAIQNTDQQLASGTVLTYLNMLQERYPIVVKTPYLFPEVITEDNTVDGGKVACFQRMLRDALAESDKKKLIFIPLILAKQSYHLNDHFVVLVIDPQHGNVEYFDPKGYDYSTESRWVKGIDVSPKTLISLIQAEMKVFSIQHNSTAFQGVLDKVSCGRFGCWFIGERATRSFEEIIARAISWDAATAILANKLKDSFPSQ